MLMKCRTPVEPSLDLYETQPASSRRGIPVRRMSTAAFGSSGIFKVRLKSPPVPSGSIPSRLVVGMGAPLWKKPLTTSLSVPSPPTATITGRDSLTARSAISVASSGRVVSTASYGIPVEGSHVVIPDHSRPARPAPEAGLTMNSTSATTERLRGRAGS